MDRRSLESHRVTRRTVIAGVAATAAVGLRVRSGVAQTGTPAATPSTGPIALLRVGLIPAEDAEVILTQYQPLTDYLREALKVEDLELYRATDYTAVVEAMRADNLDLALFGPFSYILAHEIAGAESVASAGDDEGTPSTSRSLIVTRQDSGIATLEDLRGRSFSFVDPASTSGYLIPRFNLVNNGIDPDEDLETIFAGGHDASLLAIDGGRVDAGAVADTIFNTMGGEGLIDLDDFVVLLESDPIPESPFAVRGNLDPALKERIKQALLSAHETLGAETMNALLDENGDRLVDAPDALYDPLREVVDGLDLDLEELAN